ncbi:hypothetical protein SAMN05216304_103382 [Bosea sp. OK403]|uniref:hypothetical protein n=1 Tax=Bosea sp. OK403 TaxID=1855286 RepID=UPI0008F007B3|nr:hypothetical protein [Bosea sp. OK403]SFI74842.1 hypothetical protein SAMN05216304_103382 [Bosea sp. OK403]
MKQSLFTLYLLPFLMAGAAHAAEKDVQPAESSVAVIGLRGGYDSNPLTLKGEKGSPTATVFATWDYLHGTLQDGYGVNLTLAETQYDPRVLAAARLHTLTLKHAVPIGDATVVQTSILASNEQSWSRRRSSLGLRGRIDHAIGALRLFASVEGRLTALNERNVFNLGDFLPKDENFGTASLTSGAAWRIGESEVGASFTGSRTHFLDGVDYLGLRRDHDRVQPNLFISTKIGEATLEGSLSPFRAIFPKKEFETVSELLYTAKGRIPYGALAFEFASSRTVEDTTLPFSAIDLVTAHEIKLTAKINEANAVALSLRRKTDNYLGLEALSDQKSVGVDYQRALGNGLTATASASLRKTKETGLEPVTSFSLMLGLQKQIDFSKPGKPEKAGG